MISYLSKLWSLNICKLESAKSMLTMRELASGARAATTAAEMPAGSTELMFLLRYEDALDAGLGSSYAGGRGAPRWWCISLGV